MREPRWIFYPYKMGSASCKGLVNGLKAIGKRVLRVRENGRFRPRRTDKIVNWGNSNIPSWSAPMLNEPRSVINAANKLRTFTVLRSAQVPIPDFTTDQSVARGWLASGDITLHRYILTGSQGRGIILHRNRNVGAFNSARPAPLYTKYKKKKKEFRVHVFNGQVVDIQQKRKRRDRDVNYEIRNVANGWVFTREGIVEPSDLRRVALSAVSALALAFGGVDIIWNEKENKCYVLEVNTAPGLQGTTLAKYLEQIKRL